MWAVFKPWLMALHVTNTAFDRSFIVTLVRGVRASAVATGLFLRSALKCYVPKSVAFDTLCRFACLVVHAAVEDL